MSDKTTVLTVDMPQGCGLTEAAAESLIRRHYKALTKGRNVMIERLLVARLLGLRCSLTEDRTDPQRTVWTLDIAGF